MSARKLVPYVLAGIGVGLCLLVIASAGLVAYDRATRPAPQEAVAQDDPVERDTDVPEDDSPASDEEPAPEPEPAPEESHYYECDYFYVDVPDAWQTGTIVEEDEGSWSFAHPEGQYVNQTILTTDPSPISGRHWLAGTASDGTQVWANDAATGFFGEGKGTITLK